MKDVDSIKEELKTQYPDKKTKQTEVLRMYNIKSLFDFISKRIIDENLSFGKNEMRLDLYKTQAGETISIQFPGKESALADETGKRRKYDFRPKVITKDGKELPDLNFYEMWSIVEKIDKNHHDVLSVVATLFFNQGRMLVHEKIKEQYKTYKVCGGNITEGDCYELELYKIMIPSDTLKSLNYNAKKIYIDDIAITYEAFLYFFELILQNEDCKYYDIKGDLSSGRISTSDSMMLLCSYLNNGISIATLLQRYVSGRGIGKCYVDNISTATEGLVEIVNIDKKIEDLFSEYNVDYRKNCTKSFSGKQVRMRYKLDDDKICIVNTLNDNLHSVLLDHNWDSFLFEDLALKINYDNLVDIIKEKYGS